MRWTTTPVVAGLLLMIALDAQTAARGDTLELLDGTVLKGCYTRDEGVQYTVWKTLADVGVPPVVYPRNAVKKVTIERGEDWDRHPDRPDLSVTFIEIDPKLAGLHGVVQYDELGRPWIGGAKPLVDLGDRKFTDPEAAVKNLKLQYAPGDELTLTAHVKNLGFAPAQPFRWAFFVGPEGAQTSGPPLATGDYAQPLAEMEEATFTAKWKWAEGRYLVTFRVMTAQPEIATLNNEATDALWAWPFTFVVSHGRVAAWHVNRSAYGTFSFEDFYRWHVDIMNLLFAHSVFPAAPQGIRARVRLDRIVYADKVQDNLAYVAGQAREPGRRDGIRYDQGVWFWNDSPEELQSGKWSQVDKEWRNQTEWSLPHELGHQLGLVDWYACDYEGDTDHVWADNCAKVTHFQRYALQMMHWHGPQVFGEADAAYLNMTMDRPRGYFGDYYFAIPRENFVRVSDINGRGMPNAKVEIFQRGVVVDPKGQSGEDHGVRYFAVIEDGNFDHPVSQDPVIVGQTDAEGRLRLPNRPAAEVRTLNGFDRQPNPFGNINVVGQRALLLVRVTKNEHATYHMLEAWDFIIAWFRGQRDRFTVSLQTPFASVDSPPPPTGVTVRPIAGDEHHVKLMWQPPQGVRPQNYLDRVIGYRVYRRFGNDDLNERPWFPAATLGPEAREIVLDLRDKPDDIYWYAPHTQRFGVASIATGSLASELAETLLK
jgi:hypothetical protein